MAQDNFNPEKEPTPERKWWNRFERQSEFEHTDENEKQLERTKELKSAAKKRGHLWETFLPTKEETDVEPPIAPKGEKVRKKWRALLRRKSEVQVEEFQQQHPQTIDGYWLAQLMIAERILTLHELLEQSEPKTSERKALKTELDVMGLLSEKLSDPEIGVPREIEETYRVIVDVIARGDTAIDVEELPDIVPEQDEKETTSPDPERSRSFERYGAAVIIALRLAVSARKETEVVEEEQPKPTVPQHTPEPGVGVVSTITPRPVGDGIPSQTPHETPNIAPHVALTALIARDEKHERTHPEQIIETPQHVPDMPVVLHSPNAITTPETPRPTPNVPTPSQELEHVALEITGPNKKFDHMSTIELLTLAQNISIGNGQYLARAYQDGKIDRDGLIAVLKSFGRKGNYQYEYRSRSAEYISRKKGQGQPAVVHQAIVDTSHDDAQRVKVSQDMAQPTAPLKQHPYYPKLQRKLNEAMQQSIIVHSLRIVTFVGVVICTLWLML